MPKSFLIRKRGHHPQGPCPRNHGQAARDGAGSSSGTSLNATPSPTEAPTPNDVKPCSALNDDDKIVEPLDLMVTRVRDDEVQILECVQTLEGATSRSPDGDRQLLGKTPADGTNRFLYENSPRQVETPDNGPVFYSNTYPDSLADYEGRRQRRYSYEPESPLSSVPGHPGVGYFSRCLLEYKLKGSLGLDASKRHYCQFCSKGFNDKFDLKRHIRTHTGVRPYKCDRCFRAFTQRCSLEVHQRKVHSMELNFAFKQRRGKVYVCEDCGHSTHDINQHYAHSVREHRFTSPFGQLGSGYRPSRGNAPAGPDGAPGSGRYAAGAPAGIMPEFDQPVSAFSEANYRQARQGGSGVMPGTFY